MPPTLAAASPTLTLTRNSYVGLWPVTSGPLPACTHSMRRAVYALCMRLCADPHEAGEATQDTFVRVWQRLASFRNDSAFGSWVHRIAVNAALERQRADRRRRARVVSAAPLTLVAFAVTGEKLDERLDLDAALQHLAPLARTVFVLREIEGYPYAELSELLGLSQVALRAQLSRARATIMQRLAKASDGAPRENRAQEREPDA